MARVVGHAAPLDDVGRAEPFEILHQQRPGFADPLGGDQLGEGVAQPREIGLPERVRFVEELEAPLDGEIAPLEVIAKIPDGVGRHAGLREARLDRGDAGFAVHTPGARARQHPCETAVVAAGGRMMGADEGAYRLGGKRLDGRDEIPARRTRAGLVEEQDLVDRRAEGDRGVPDRLEHLLAAPLVLLEGAIRDPLEQVRRELGQRRVPRDRLGLAPLGGFLDRPRHRGRVAHQRAGDAHGLGPAARDLLDELHEVPFGIAGHGVPVHAVDADAAGPGGAQPPGEVAALAGARLLEETHHQRSQVFGGHRRAEHDVVEAVAREVLGEPIRADRTPDRAGSAPRWSRPSSRVRRT